MDKQKLEKHLSERFKGTKYEMMVEVNKHFPEITQKVCKKHINIFGADLFMHKFVGSHVETFSLCEENIANAHLFANAYPLLIAALKLQFLNGCEEEGIASGMPTPDEWREAFEELEDVLNKILNYGE